jgi:hypothetical protein
MPASSKINEWKSKGLQLIGLGTVVRVGSRKGMEVEFGREVGAGRGEWNGHGGAVPLPVVSMCVAA